MNSTQSTPGSSRLPRPGLSSRSHTPTASRPSLKSYSSSSHSASPSVRSGKSHLPAPKVLPFPDLPVRGISREGSRASSPTLSPRGSFGRLSNGGGGGGQDGLLAASSVAMATGASSEGAASTSGEVRTSPLSMSASPPVSSPLASASNPHLFQSLETTRARSSTSPAPLRTRATSPLSVAPTRTSGFNPSLSPLPVGASPAQTPVVPTQSASSLAAVMTGPAPPPAASKPRPPVPAKKPSLAAASAHAAPAAAPHQLAAPAHHLADHMYDSLLKGLCADIRITIKKWGVCYHVHKMVLVQAGFFHSLFLGGFSETAGQGSRWTSRKGKERATEQENDWMGDDVELKFDDPNITRAAFEICLSRLYSSRPQLEYPAAIVPTTSQPLTPSFPHGPAKPIHRAQQALAPHSHLATPHLLLSLLATTTYLGQTQLMREVIIMILQSVGPMTFGRYLGFAIGEGVGEEEWPGQADEGASHLAGVARPIPGRYSRSTTMADDHTHPPTPDWRDEPAASESTRLEEDEGKVSDFPSVQPGVTRSSSGASTATLSAYRSLSLSERRRRPSASAQSDTSSALHAQMPHFYGFASNKIGEACMCWLARWGTDVLPSEINFLQNAISAPPYRIWAHRGLPARFVCAVIGSDSFFVTDEMARYTFARQVLDLRRKGWEAELDARGGGDISLSGGSSAEPSEAEMDGLEEWEDDEAELAKVFADGIHYSHMSFDDLSFIAADTDPSTAMPYAPLHVLQAAHWTAADLRSRICSHPGAGQASPSDSREDFDPASEPELGFAVTTESIRASGSRSRRITPGSRVPTPMSAALRNDLTATGVERKYHPIPADDTHRLGAGGLLFRSTTVGGATLSSLQGVPDLGPELDDNATTPSARRPPPQSETTCFGLASPATHLSRIIASGANASLTTTKQPARWTRLEPFRFSVEFFNLETLSEKERMYSSTHFHAGSWWNVYVQMIRKKDRGAMQMGIYLHRQDVAEGVPEASERSPRSGVLAPSAAIRTVSETGAARDASAPVRSPVAAAEQSAMGSSPLGPAIGASTSRRQTVGSPPIASHMENVIAAFTPNLHHRSSVSAIAVPPASLGMRRDLTGDLGNAIGLDVGPGGRSPAGQAVPRSAGTHAEAWVDTRRFTKAYFSISCASALGTALTRFTSAPDRFALSQSWGWKSTQLRSEEYVVSPDAAESASEAGRSPAAQVESGDGGISLEAETLENGVLGWVADVSDGRGLTGSLRATVVVGIV